MSDYQNPPDNRSCPPQGDLYVFDRIGPSAQEMEFDLNLNWNEIAIKIYSTDKFISPIQVLQIKQNNNFYY